MPLDAVPPVRPAFELTVATQGMSKGTLQSEGAQFVPRAILKSGRVQLYGQWKNVDTNSARGEASVGAGWNGKAGGTDLVLSLAYKMLTSARGSGNRSSWEFTGTASRKWGKLGMKGSAVYSPDDFGGTRSSLYVEAGPSLDLPWKLRASAAVGHRWRTRNRDYTAYNVGLSRPIGKVLTADLRYYDTDKGEFGESFDNRVVGSIKLAI